MSYLEIIEKLKKAPEGGPSTPVTPECRDEINEKNESSPPATPEPAVTGGELAPCGSPTCGGCYSVGESNGRTPFIHPPKPSPEWAARWLRNWHPPKGTLTQ